jgi:hypothetical protein
MGLNFQTCTIINSNVDLDSKGKVLFEGVKTKVDGKEVTWDMNKILQDAGLPNAFKSGGSINLNKLSKFLNYAKG